MKVEKFKVLLYLKRADWTSRAKSDNGTHHREPDDGAVQLQALLHSRAVESP